MDTKQEIQECIESLLKARELIGKCRNGFSDGLIFQAECEIDMVVESLRQ